MTILICFKSLPFNLNDPQILYCGGRIFCTNLTDFMTLDQLVNLLKMTANK